MSDIADAVEGGSKPSGILTVRKAAVMASIAAFASAGFPQIRAGSSRRETKKGVSRCMCGRALFSAEEEDRGICATCVHRPVVTDSVCE